MKFSVIIPTYNREEDLKECFDSIMGQSLLPSEILIVDDGEIKKEVLEDFEKKAKEKNISFLYYKKDHQRERRGSAESRNIGLNLVKNEFFFILDDDLILDNDFFEKIMKVWQENKDSNLIGVGGIIKNSRKKGFLEMAFNKFFGLTSKNKWDVNEVGFQVWDEGIQAREKGYYSHGGICSYKKELMKNLGGFRLFEGGRTALEDVEFCLRAKKRGYYFTIEPEAKVIHKKSLKSKESDFLIGFKESVNRKIIFKENCEKSLKNYLWFFWSNIGWILRQWIACFIEPKLFLAHFFRGLGMLRGFCVFIPSQDNAGENFKFLS